MRAFDLAAVVIRTGDERPDRAHQCVGQLQRVPPCDVEAVEEPATDQVQVARHRSAHFTVGPAQLGEHLLGIVVRLEPGAGRSVDLERSDQPTQLVGSPRGDRRRPAHHRQCVGRLDVGPGHQVGEEVADRHHGRGGEAHVLVHHLPVVVAAPFEVRRELGVRERVGVDGLELAVPRDRRRLRDLVPLPELLAPDLAGPDLLGARRSAAGSRPRAAAASWCTRSR